LDKESKNNIWNKVEIIKRDLPQNRDIILYVGSMKLTPFESEILDSILWQVEGFRLGRVTQRATTRILRATMRRIQPRIIARSQLAETGERERDHAIPLRVICDRILATDNLDRIKLTKILSDWLVIVELTAQEHREVLHKCGLSRCMPNNWNEVDPLARYRHAGIQLHEIPNRD
jgi:hypothetical protein